jgi:hypothetical protein
MAARDSVPDMSPRTLARLYGAGRSGFGLAFMFAPGPAGARWIGSDAEQPSVQVLTAALGIRDLALGAGLLSAVQTGAPTGAWTRLAALSDAVDFVATLRGRSHIPTGALVGTLVAAAGGTALGLYLQSALD